MKGKRIIAYLIDVIAIGILCSFIEMLPFFEADRKASEEYTEYTMNALLGSGSADLDEDEINQKTYEFQKDSIRVSVLNLGITVIYFSIGGFLLKGQTLGKKAMKIKIVANNDGEEIKPGLYFIREILKTGVIFDFISLLILMVCTQSIFMSTSTIISYASDIVLLVIIGTMIFRDDERGLHDVICKTKVISTEQK